MAESNEQNTNTNTSSSSETESVANDTQQSDRVVGRGEIVGTDQATKSNDNPGSEKDK